MAPHEDEIGGGAGAQNTVHRWSRQKHWETNDARRYMLERPAL